MDPDYQAVVGLAAALACGLLIGTERGWETRAAVAGSRVAGLRTFGLLGLTGGLAAVLTRYGSEWLGIVLAAGAGAAMLAGYVRSMMLGPDVSATTAVTAMLTLGVGALAGSGHAGLAAGTSVVMIVLLTWRAELHRWIAALGQNDIKSMVRFGLVALVALPLLPDRNYGPFDAWNPHTIWLVVVIVSGISLIGYFASRQLGTKRGTLVMAAVGATVSSTAVTASLARTLRANDGSAKLAAAGISLASAVMFARALVLTAVLVPRALPSLALVIGPGCMVAIGFALWLMRRPGAALKGAPAPVSNPFDLRPGLVLAGLVALVSLAARAATAYYGDAGVTTVLAIAGMADVDSAIMAMHGLPADTVGPRAAGLILAAPSLLNTLFKAAITVTLGGWSHGWRAALPLVASVVVALIALGFVLLG